MTGAVAQSPALVGAGAVTQPIPATFIFIYFLNKKQNYVRGINVFNTIYLCI
jgi:hypothetical protein